MVVLGEKLRRVQLATQPGSEVVSGAFFSQKQCIRPTLLTTRKRLVYADHARYVWSRAIHRPSVECVWHVDQVSRAGCTSI
jgi:hypothetical protein